MRPLSRGDAHSTFGRLALLALVVVLVLAAAYLASVLATREQRAAGGRAPSPGATGVPAAVTPTPVPSAKPGKAPEMASPAVDGGTVVHDSSVTLPWPTAAVPTAATSRQEKHRPAARPHTPTPSVAQCVAVSWSASMSAAAPGQVLVDVTATNHCDRALGPLDVWFRVSGYHEGALVRSVVGHPFDPLPRGGSVTTTIGLPGSIDWYDRIAVQTFGPR